MMNTLRGKLKAGTMCHQTVQERWSLLAQRGVNLYTYTHIRPNIRGVVLRTTAQLHAQSWENHLAIIHLRSNVLRDLIEGRYLLGNGH